MPNVYVSGLAWIDVGGYPLDLIGRIKKALTKKPRKTSRYQSDDDLEPIEMFRTQDNLLGVPREYFRRNRTLEHAPILRVTPGVPWSIVPVSTKQLRDDQPKGMQVVLELFEKQRKHDGFAGCVVEAPPGWGKTVFALHLAREVALKTLVLVRTEQLRDQWIERVKDQLPGLKTGVIQGDRCDAEADVIAAVMDTITTRPNLPVYDDVGLVIGDEVHRLGARKWSPILNRFNGPYRIGLSAKPHRKDGMDAVIYDNIGPKAFIGVARRCKAVVYPRRTGWSPPPMRDNPDKLSEQTIISMMVTDTMRNKLIVDDIIKAAKAGRKSIVFSGRREHLDALRTLFAKNRPPGKTDGFLMGGSSEKDVARSNRCDVIWATYDYVAEGYDNDELNTVFLTTPISDPDQPVGRGCRWKASDPNRIAYVIDYVDLAPKFVVRWLEARKKVYRQREMEVKLPGATHA